MSHERRYPDLVPRKLVVFDVDSTLIDNEVIELLADEAGSLSLVAEVTDRAMRGDIDFEASLRERVQTLAGLSTEARRRAAEQITITPGVRELISAVHAADGWVCAVSGGFSEILEPLARDLRLNRWLANTLEVNERGDLTGELTGKIVDAEAKKRALLQWAVEGGFEALDTVAIGDGANDLLMMQAAGLSIAFCAKPIVRAAAMLAIDERDMRLAIALLGL